MPLMRKAKADPTVTSPKVRAKMEKAMLLAELVDKLGEIKAEISELCKDEDVLKKELIASKLDVIEGSLFKATITRSTRASLDPEKVAELLDEAQMQSCMKVSPVVTVRVTAKTRT